MVLKAFGGSHPMVFSSLLRSLKRRGLKGTLWYAWQRSTSLIGQWLLRRWRSAADWTFDRRFKVDTGGCVRAPEGDDRWCDSRKYEASPSGMFQLMLALLRLDYRRFAFVDFGCGKGRVLLMAARKPFREVVGVELSDDLSQTAERNIATFRRHCRSTDVRAVCMDAGDFPIPSGPVVLYFYNPFYGTTMERVISNILRSLEREPREMYLLYFIPACADMFERVECFEPIHRNRLFVIFRAKSGDRKREEPSQDSHVPLAR